MEENNNLKGLKLVFIGFIIQIIGQAFNGDTASHAFKDTSNISSLWKSMATADSVVMVLSGLISLVGLILIIVGLSKVKRVSPYFRKARNLYIANILIGVAFVVVIAIMAGSIIAIFSSAVITKSAPGTNGAVIGTFIVAVLIAIVMSVITILSIRALMLGCSDVARDHGDNAYANKCRKTWKMYLLSLIIMIISVVVVIIASISSIMSIYSSYGSDSSINYAGIAGGLLGAMAFVVAAAIFMLVVQIFILVRIWKTYSKFNGKAPELFSEVSQEAGGVKSEWEHVEPKTAALPEATKKEDKKPEATKED